MSRLRARPYAPQDADAWDDVVGRAWNGSFLHTRRFISFAESRFEETSLVIEDGGHVVGVFPAAIHPTDPTMVESHPAISYGGIVHDGSLGGASFLQALESVAERYYHDGARSLRYKAMPGVYQRLPTADDLYALFRMAAIRSRCDLASVIDVLDRPPASRRRVRSLGKARRAGVQVQRGSQHLEALWGVLTERLATKFGAEPLHTLPEMHMLCSAFPEQIEFVVGVLSGRVVAGVVLFHTGQTDHFQYIAADDRGYAASALDMIIEQCIEDARSGGRRYVSLGNSTLYGGHVLNETLHKFKSEFGAGSVVHEAYDLRLG